MRCGNDTGQTIQGHFAAQCVNDAQHLRQSYSGFARLQLHDKAHTDPGCQCQLRLRERQLLAGSANGIAQFPEREIKILSIVRLRLR